MSFQSASAALILLASVAAAQNRICVVRTIDGRELRGEVTVEKPETARVGEVSLGVDEIVSIDQAAFVGERKPLVTNELWLRSGARLPFNDLSGVAPTENSPPAVRVGVTVAAREVQFLLGHLAALRMERKDGLIAPTLEEDMAEPHRTLDYLYVESDGRLRRFSVTIEKLEGSTIHFDLRGSKLTVELDRLVAIVFGENTGVRPDPQALPRAHAITRDGITVPGRLLSLGDTCVVRLDEGAEIEMPRNTVRRIDIVSDKLVFLSALEPKVEQTPALDRTWPVYRDRAPGGPGIQLGGVSYSRGIVVVPRTRLTYDLGGRYDVLETVIGIEDRAGPQAHAIFRVFADDTLVFESEPFTRATKPETLRLDIGSAKTLTLEADFGKNLDLGDHCVFADARIVQN